jgi:hypothetical protein
MKLNKDKNKLITEHPLMQGAAISLGNTQTYMNGYNEKSEFSSIYTGKMIVVGDHEYKHTEQSKILGPLYLPVYIGSGGWWSNHGNWMERQADEYGRQQLNKS